MGWKLNKGEITIDPCVPGTYDNTLPVLKAVLGQICQGAEYHPFLNDATWHGARCSMIQWGRDHGAKEEDFVAHMNSKTLAMADTYTRDKTILSLRLLNKINTGVRKEAEEQEQVASTRTPRSAALSKSAPSLPRNEHWTRRVHLRSNLKDSVQLPSTNACPRCLLKMSIDQLPGHDAHFSPRPSLDPVVSLTTAQSTDERSESLISLWAI